MVFVRSRRSTGLFAGAALGVMLVLAGSAGLLAAIHRLLAALVAAMLALVSGAVLLRTLIRLRRWPTARLGFFRDRLVLVQGRTELQAQWELVETVTLADQGDWSAGRWPEVRLTDRLTVRVQAGRRFSFRPATFGVEPAACRDLVLRLRDEPQLRDKLPEFDSILDLSSRPLHAGDLARPEL